MFQAGMPTRARTEVVAGRRRPTALVDGEPRMPGCTPPVFVVLTRPGRGGYEVLPAQHCGQVSGPVALFMDADLAACRRGWCQRPSTDLRFDCANGGFVIGRRWVDLTQQEFDMLALLVASPHRVWSREELARLVLRVPHTVQSDGNVRVRAHNLRKKLGPLAYQIRTIRSGGYQFDAHPGQLV